MCKIEVTIELNPGEVELRGGKVLMQMGKSKGREFLPAKNSRFP